MLICLSKLACFMGIFQGERGGEGLSGNQGPSGDTPLLSPKGEKVSKEFNKYSFNKIYLCLSCLIYKA